MAANLTSVRLTASDIYTLHRPSDCGLRVYLQHQGVQADPPSAFEEIILRLGSRHELAHLETLPDAVDLRDGTIEERERRTREEVRRRARAIYQAVLRTEIELSGIKCEIVGEPDFLIFDSDRYLIRDSRLARRINGRDHPEILGQVSLYGWLFERCLGEAPAGLEIHNGSGEIVPVDYDGDDAVLDILREILGLKTCTAKPYSPVGWSKCAGCPYNTRCWQQAEESRDVARVVGVDKGLAIALREEDVTTPEELVNQFDEARLADFQRPWGQRRQRVGKAAGGILTMARALISGQETVLQQPQIPDSSNYVMFDLEGLPPFLDDLEKTYLWGMRVYGERPSEFLPAVAGFSLELGPAEAAILTVENETRLIQSDVKLCA
jgi:predicted RecB family nuclease